MYAVRAGEFEGPLELLLDLIESRKFSINEVSLASITDEYLLHVKSFAKLDPEEVASFLVVAATLMLIKSRSLLPSVEITEEERADIKELEDRLKIYQTYRDFAHYIENLQKEGKHMYNRESYTDFPILFYPPESLTLHSMVGIVEQVIAQLPQKEILPQRTIQKIVSIEEKMEELKTRMQKAISHSFHHFVKDKSEKVDIIISFLAMLELFKEGTLLVHQENLFEDITMQKANHE